MKTTDELHALAALGEAATPLTGALPDTDAQKAAADLYIAAKLHMRELVERVLKAEAIVRDVAANEPVGVYDSNYYGDLWGFWCEMCGGHANRPKAKAHEVERMKLDEHAESCPWRRAVEASR